MSKVIFDELGIKYYTDYKYRLIFTTKDTYWGLKREVCFWYNKNDNVVDFKDPIEVDGQEVYIKDLSSRCIETMLQLTRTDGKIEK